MLNVFSYALTIVTVAAWADAYYARSKYLRTELFLTTFCALFVLALVHARRLGTGRGKLVAIVLASAPVFYHAASLGILAAHGVAFLVYIIAFTVVGTAPAARVDRCAPVPQLDRAIAGSPRRRVRAPPARADRAPHTPSGGGRSR
jgi:hypothetical protein